MIATTGLVALMGDYISAYGTTQGQLLLIGWLGAYLACLLWLRRITAGRPMPRFLDATLAGAGAGAGVGGGGR